MPASSGATLTPNVVKKITITDSYPHGITIIKLPNSDGTVPSAPIWYRLDGSDPVPGADDSFVCLDAVFIPNPAESLGQAPNQASEGVEVRLIATAAVSLTVEGNATWKRV